MSRMIDADALIEKAYDEAKGMAEPYDDFGTLVEWLVDKAPTIEPEPKWIPCSETVDIPDHEIMACDKYGEEMFGYLAYEDEQWLCASDGCVMYDPIAWREKPEPYREEGEQE